MDKHNIFVFAKLKPSQINYKIIPLCNSELVERVYILRKSPLELDNKKVICFGLPLLLRSRFLYWFLTPVYGIWLIKKNNVDLIISYNIFPHGFNGYLASVITGRSFIFSEINEDTLNYYKKPFWGRIVKKILAQAELITVPGKQTEARWIKNGYANLVRLHSTIDTDQPLLSKYEKRFDFIFIGEFDGNKRPDLILNAFIALRANGINATICFIGFGKMKRRLEDAVYKNALTHCVTIVKTNSVFEYLSESKIFVMASLSEGLPCAMMEAMAYKLVVLVPPVGDIPDVVADNMNGFLHNNTEEDILAKMVHTYNSYEDLGEVRSKAREMIIKEHSFPVASKSWDNLLTKFIKPV